MLVLTGKPPCMQLKNTSKWLVICGTLAIWTIKFGIRPVMDTGGLPRFALGIAPNFLGAFLLPFGAFWLAEKWLFPTRSMWDVKMQGVVFFVLLVMNEYLQLLPVFGRTFDVFDMVFSAAGLCLSYAVFGRLYTRYLYITQQAV
jgi:hypothetical protein